jgi:hypothetical protein
MSQIKNINNHRCPWKKTSDRNDRPFITVSRRITINRYHGGDNFVLPYVCILHGIHPRLDTNDTNKKRGERQPDIGIIT